MIKTSIENGKKKYIFKNHELTCKFFQDNHEYFLGYHDEEKNEFIKIKKLKSVTQLLKEIGVSANYNGINSAILTQKAEYGSLVHKELEKWFKCGDLGFTDELYQWLEAVQINDIIPKESEQIVFNDVIAGTLDTTGFINGFSYLGDFKTTAKFHDTAVSWQLSIYEYLKGEVFDKLIGFWFSKKGLQIKEVERIPTEYIDILMENEREGENKNDDNNK